MSVDKDLAYLKDRLQGRDLDALVRVEAELSRLREEERRLNGYIDQYIQDVGRLREQRDEWKQKHIDSERDWRKEWLAREAAEARCAELETSLPENYMETLGGAEARCARLTEENERLDGLRALYLKSADEWSERCARLQQALALGDKWLDVNYGYLNPERDPLLVEFAVATREALAGPEQA